MEELIDPNLGYVRIVSQLSFSVSPNNSFSLTVANIVPGTIFLPVGLLITGWTAQNHVFWLVSDIMTDLTVHACRLRLEF